MDNSINDDTAIDFASFRPLVWLGLLMVALWVIFFMTLPSWAGWTFAIILGLATEREQRAEIQEGIDRAGHG
jgi:hypothetical protein